MSDNKDRDKDGSGTPPLSSSSSSGNQRAPNGVWNNPRLLRLDGEIDSVAAKIEAKEGKLEDLCAQRRQAVIDEKVQLGQLLAEDIDKLEQSIADLKAEKNKLLEQRDRLTQSLSVNTDFYQEFERKLVLQESRKNVELTQLRAEIDQKIQATLSNKSRPPRTLSYITKSQAWQTIRPKIKVNCPFWFPLVDLPDTDKDCVGFSSKACDVKEDEDSKHHPYFLKQMRSLVKFWEEKELKFRQQLHWSKSGNWLKLDDAPDNGVQPDHALTLFESGDRVPASSAKSTKPSKYKVTVALEQKKEYSESDQMEAIDYAERLLCIQQGRLFALSALFYCNHTEKKIRWFRVSNHNDRFEYESTDFESLTPNSVGLHQLLTVMCLSSSDLGCDLPEITLNNEEHQLEVQKLLGVGATSKVYLSLYEEQRGALKVFHSDFQHLASPEYAVLDTLNEVAAVPSGVLVAPNAIFFPVVLHSLSSLTPTTLSNILDCLQLSHENDIVHRDIRPENLMCSEDDKGKVYVNDWGCASDLKTPVSFSGTFRYASDEVLEAAINNSARTAQPQDDLHSLVRTFLALHFPYVRWSVAELGNGDFTAARNFWAQFRQTHPNYEWMFEAAESRDYQLLKGLV